MVVIFATLGYQANSLIPTLSKHKSKEKLVLFYTSEDAKVKAAVDEVHRYCKSTLKLEYEDVRLKDPYDLVATALTMKKAISEYKGREKEIIFNITGSTKVISAAAMVVCIVDGITAVYVNERTGEEYTLPLLNVKSKNIATPTQLEILRLIRDNGGAMIQNDIAAKMKSKPATVSLQLKEMRERGLVKIERDPNNMRANIVRNAEHVPLLLYEEGCK